MSSSNCNDEHTPGTKEASRKNSKMPVAKPPVAGANASPFHLNERDVEVLLQSEGFAILREHLAEHYADEYAHPSRGSDHVLTDVRPGCALRTQQRPHSPPNSTFLPATSYTLFSSPLSSSSTKLPLSPLPQHTPRRSSSWSSATLAPRAVPSSGSSVSWPLRKSETGVTPKAVPLVWSTTR